MKDNEIKEMRDDFKGYTSGTGKTAHDLAQLYLTIAGKIPEERKCSLENYRANGCVRCPIPRVVVCDVDIYNFARQECILAMMKGLPSVKDGACYYCGKMTDSLAGNPGQWAVMLCHSDDPGKVKYHHQLCVSKRLELPSVEELTRIISNYCDRRGFDEYTKCAEAIHARLEKGIK